MALKLKDGDYIPNGTGGLVRTDGTAETLLREAVFRLTARRESFPFLPELGSSLWKLGRLGASQRPAAAKQYVTDALRELTDVSVTDVSLTESGGTGALNVTLVCADQTYTVTLDAE